MSSKQYSSKGLQRIRNAARFSWQGLSAAWKHEVAFRQELMFCLPLLPLAFWLGESVVQQILLISSLILVLIMEILNSAIEAVVDRHGSEHHVLAGRAKDMGSAAVLLALINAGVVWGLILLQRFI